MRLSRILAARRFYAELDYARHFPQAYVDRLKRTVPRKVYDAGVGAPPVIMWRRPPDDYVPGTERPWAQSEITKAIEREKEYFNSLLDWAIFPGDKVMVMVGKDKGKRGEVSHVIRDANAVFVDQLNTKLEDHGTERMGLEKMVHWKPQPLFVDKDEVKLIDPHDDEPCESKWVVDEENQKYVRVSERTGYEIIVPSQASVTYEYSPDPSNYIEVKGKDTIADDVLKKTYEPKLCTFEEDIMNEYGIKDDREPKPTYWY
ncbi:KOW motif domain-containing protein [Ditylenchus destructor]|uniref:Large ribosomal subunit protein uL24m n=1 Tax=Ditylenchus destructor TaxID=166010 RepID=A0AAD4NBC7_9BILA|nr:KOW motif domain-containing protein [Ditylenchus destructor]